MIDFKNPIGNNFLVEEGFLGQGLPKGYIVTYKPTGHWLWTGNIISLYQARDILIKQSSLSSTG